MDIVNLKVKDIYDVDNLTQNKTWKILSDLLEDNDIIKDESKVVVLDFTGINVVDPWTLSAFNDILKNERLHFKFVSCNEEYLNTLANKLKMTCILEGLDSERFSTVYVNRPRQKTKEELRTDKIGEQLLNAFVVDNKTSSAVLEINKVYDQICSLTTVNAIVFAVKALNKNKNITDFTIKTGKIFIQDNMIKLLAKYIVEFGRVGIEFKVDTDVSDTISKLGLNIYTESNESYSMLDRLNEFVKVRKNTPGILVKYKKSRAIDDFGRSGKGQVVSSRIAVFRGLCAKTGYNSADIITEVKEIKDGWMTAKLIVDNNKGNTSSQIKKISLDSIAICIDSFNNDTFITHAEWLSRYDNEIVDSNGDIVTELPYTREIIDIDQCGLFDKFLGVKYHFLRAIQKSKDENKKIIVDINEKGNSVSKEVTIPERIKIVLKDWGVQVDPVELMKAISETNKVLEQ